MNIYSIIFALITTAAIALSEPAQADYSQSQAWFATLAPIDRVVVQADLVLLGKYEGLVDGSFGPDTYNALVAFETGQGGVGDGVPSSAELDSLTKGAKTVYGELGIDRVADSAAGLAIFLPQKLLTEKGSTKRGMSYATPDGSFELQTIRMPSTDQSFADLYQKLGTKGPARQVAYAETADGQFSISGIANHRYFYTRFYDDGSQSVGYSLSWDTKYRPLGAMLATFMASFSYPLSQQSAPGNEAVQKQDIGAGGGQPSESVEIGLGSGFFFAAQGMIATNYHVAGTCKSLTVTGYGPAKLIASDKDLDLAAIQLDAKTGGPAAPISTKPPELAQSVILLGYPLADVLNSSLNVSTGIVSSEDGAGDPNWFTTNAGIEPGNSGGPVLDDQGNVLGMAVAKVNDEKLLKSAGTVAPNVGFAIKSTTLLRFLGIFLHVEAPQAVGPVPSTQEVVRKAKDFTVQIVCEEDGAKVAAGSSLQAATPGASP